MLFYYTGEIDTCTESASNGEVPSKFTYINDTYIGQNSTGFESNSAPVSAGYARMALDDSPAYNLVLPSHRNNNFTGAPQRDFIVGTAVTPQAPELPPRNVVEKNKRNELEKLKERTKEQICRADSDEDPHAPYAKLVCQNTCENEENLKEVPDDVSAMPVCHYAQLLQESSSEPDFTVKSSFPPISSSNSDGDYVTEAEAHLIGPRSRTDSLTTYIPQKTGPDCNTVADQLTDNCEITAGINLDFPEMKDAEKTGNIGSVTESTEPATVNTGYIDESELQRFCTIPDECASVNTSCAISASNSPQNSTRDNTIPAKSNYTSANSIPQDTGGGTESNKSTHNPVTGTSENLKTKRAPNGFVVGSDGYCHTNEVV